MGEPQQNVVEPWKQADAWRSAAIAAAVITPSCILLALPWILEAATDQSMLHRVQIVGAGAAVGLAIVTFCTVLWRGLISAQQAELQRQQIDRITRQIEVTEENSGIERLQRGAELLSDHNKDAQVAAGIATLHAVAVSPRGQFAVQAMDLLASYLEDRGPAYLCAPLSRAAISALYEAQERFKRTSTRQLYFDYSGEFHEEDYESLQLVAGVRRVTYYTGSFDAEEITQAATLGTDIRFNRVIFHEGHIDLSVASFERCRFRLATILTYHARTVADCHFEDCDFSGCLVDNPSTFPDLRAKGNWFYPSRPPASSHPFDWETRLNRGKPPSSDEDNDEDI